MSIYPRVKNSKVCKYGTTNNYLDKYLILTDYHVKFYKN